MRRRLAATALVGTALTAGLSACGTSAAAQNAYQSVYKATVGGGSADMTVALKEQTKANTSTVTLSGSVDFTHDSANLTANLGGNKMTLIESDNSLYVQVPPAERVLTGNKLWVKAIGDNSTPSISSALLGGDPSSWLKIVASHATHIQREGQATVGGTELTEYGADVDLGAAAGSSGSGAGSMLAQLAGSSIPVHVWIDSSNRLHQLTMSVTVSKLPASAQGLPPSITTHMPLTLYLQVDFSNFGTPVHVDVPSASEVISIPLSLLEQSIDSKTTSSS